jgi:hypothetical protein
MGESAAVINEGWLHQQHGLCIAGRNGHCSRQSDS